MNEREDFVLRCERLQSYMKLYMAHEDSPRVWTSVISTLLVSITLSQEDPNDALDQVINAMKNMTKDQEYPVEESVKD